jgi:hypothetical protein
MTGLSILGKSGSCTTGIKFYFNDGSSQTMGTSYGGDSPILYFDSTSNRLANVSSYGGSILDVMQICTETNTCVINGNVGGRNPNTTGVINPAWEITAFWGVRYQWNGFDCLANFGIFYTDIIGGTSNCTVESNLTLFKSSFLKIV